MASRASRRKVLSKIEEIQRIIGSPVDGKWGPNSQRALEAILHPTLDDSWHHGKASSFADPADVISFHKWFGIYKDQGATDEFATSKAFSKGDNAIGCWGDSTAEGSGASCALPPEDMAERWGGVTEAKHRRVEVEANGRTVLCILKDRMPHRTNITNQAIIDLNPDAVRAIGLEPPIMQSASWRWA